MEKRVQFSPWEKLSSADANELHAFTEDSVDHIVLDTLIPGRRYTGFQVTQSAPAEITVGNGRLYDAGKVYFNDSTGGFPIDLINLLPSVTQRVVAVVVWGDIQETQLEPRTFLTDAVARTTEARDTSTEIWRWANISTVGGVPGPDPQRPGVAANVQVVAWVTVDATGIVKIERETEGEAPNLVEHDTDIKENLSWRERTGQRLDTLGSDLSSLASGIRGLADGALVRRIAGDVARVMERLQLPTTYTDYGSDHFTDISQSDTANVDYLARIEEGIRFPAVAVTDSQLGLLNPLDDRVGNTSNVLLPAWDRSETHGIDNVGEDGEVALSGYTVQTITYTNKMTARERVRYGPPFEVSGSSDWWLTGTYEDWFSQTFTRGAETFVVLDSWDSKAGERPPRTVRLQQIWKDTTEEPQARFIATTETVTGSMIAQTFLNSQGGWLFAADLIFARVAASGPVTVLVTDTVDGGRPNLGGVIAKYTIAPEDLNSFFQVGATGAHFQPTYLEKGKRYAFIFVTQGAHFYATRINNSLPSGTMWVYNGDVWSPDPNPARDLPIRLYFQHFPYARLEVQLLPLQLAGGIAAIDINSDVFEPPGTELVFEFQKDGIWHPITPSRAGPGPLVGLPALLPFRAVFMGTPQEMPSLGVGSNSRVQCWRPRPDFKHISTARLMPAPVNHVEILIRLEAWRGAPHHTCDVTLLHGVGFATETTPSAVVDLIPLDHPGGDHLYRKCTFDIAGLTTFKVNIEGTTDNVVTTFHVSERIHVGYV